MTDMPRLAPRTPPESPVTNRFLQTRELMAPHVIMDRMDLVVDLERSKGSWLHDGSRDESFFDAMTGFASLPLGWNHPGFDDPDFRRRLMAAALNKPALSDLYVPEMAEFVSTFHRVAASQFRYSFFISGGALAVENALKASFDWKSRKNLAAGSHVKADKIIHFRQCFHGRTGYTMSLTDSPDPRKTGGYPKFEWPRVENPYIRHPRTSASDAETLASEARSAAQIEGALEQWGERVAAIIIEPIQGEGGDNHFRAEFLQKLRSIADQAEIMLICDEVQSGMGVTGDWWAHEYAGITPDIICFGKKAQVCGIAATDRFDEVQGHVFQQSSRINSTWGGNLVDMVRSQRVLEIAESDNLLERVREVGAMLMAGLNALADTYPQMEGIRGRGTFIAFDLTDTETRNRLVKACFEERMLALGCGHRALRIRTHLAATTQDATELLRRLEAALARL